MYICARFALGGAVAVGFVQQCTQRQPPPKPTRKANAGGGVRECNRQIVKKLHQSPKTSTLHPNCEQSIIPPYEVPNWPRNPQRRFFQYIP